MALQTPYLAKEPTDDFGLRFPSAKYSASLAMTTDTTLTVPGDAPRYKAVIKAETDGVVWVANGATAAVPVGATFAAVSSELVPVNGVLCREVKAGDVLHFITGGSNIDVSVVFFSMGTVNTGY